MWKKLLLHLLSTVIGSRCCEFPRISLGGAYGRFGFTELGIRGDESWLTVRRYFVGPAWWSHLALGDQHSVWLRQIVPCAAIDAVCCFGGGEEEERWNNSPSSAHL